jgi:hypothetical protein
MQTPPLGLYVHLPWCVRKCPYCDFNSHAAPEQLPVESYLAALRADLEHELERAGDRTIASVFIGGGTPSLFPPDAVGRVLDWLTPRLAAGAEITLEANPGTLEQGRVAAFRWAGWYRLLPRWLRQEVVRPLVERLPDTFAYKGVSQKARWLTSVATEDAGRRYARMSSFLRFGPEERAWLYGPRLAGALEGHEPESTVARAFEGAPATDTLHRMIHAYLVTRLPEHTLMLSDRTAMAHGLEARSPLLDHRLAEFCAAMPARLKVRRGQTKVAIRKIAKNVLPEEIAGRAKQGFMFPVAYWLTPRTVPPIREALLEGPLVRNDWIRAAAVERLLGEHLRREDDHHVRIWMLQSLDAWHRVYLDGASPLELAHTLSSSAGG